MLNDVLVRVPRYEVGVVRPEAPMAVRNHMPLHIFNIPRIVPGRQTYRSPNQTHVAEEHFPTSQFVTYAASGFALTAHRPKIR